MIEAEAEEIEPDLWDTLTPLRLSWLLFLLTMLLSAWGWRTHHALKGLDVLLFAVAGLAGCVLFFLAFISEHPCTWPNYSLLWLNPLQAVGAILFCIKRAQKAAYYYHFINFAAIMLLFAGWSYGCARQQAFIKRNGQPNEKITVVAHSHPCGHQP